MSESYRLFTRSRGDFCSAETNFSLDDGSMATASKADSGEIFFALQVCQRGWQSRRGAGRRGVEVPDYSALIRAAKRDNLRETVLRCMTPLVVARCSSGWALCSAD